MVASNSSNILTDAIADEDDDANAAELLAAAEELDLDDDEDTAGSGSSSAVSLQSISVGQFEHFFCSILVLYSAASDGEAVEGDQDVIEDEDDDDEDGETDDDTDDDGSDGENEDLYAEMAMELEADNDVINGDNDPNDPGMGLHRPHRLL